MEVCDFTGYIAPYVRKLVNHPTSNAKSQEYEKIL